MDTRSLLRNDVAAWDARARDSRTSHGAALWSEHGQTTRFVRALNHLSLFPGDRVLDYGCGTARFCEFLPRDVAYWGLDSSAEMRERARREHPRATILRPDELTELDAFAHVVAIGPFNLADGWSKQQTFETLEWLYSLVEQSMIVSLYRGNDPDSIRYEEDELARFARGLSSRFVLDTVYAENDILLKVLA